MESVMRMQVVRSHGLSGSNVEYVTRLADFVRRHIPLDDDRDLFQLDARVRQLLTLTHATAGCSDWHAERPSDSVASSSSIAVAEHCDITDITAAPRRRHARVVSVLAAG